MNTLLYANYRIKEYLIGTYAYGTYKEAFLENQWTIGVEASKAKVADGVTYLSGDAIVELETVAREGYEFDGWYTDADLTQEATLSAIGLGFQDVTLYAKWTAVS